jgi:hypothetical protein
MNSLESPCLNIGMGGLVIAVLHQSALDWESRYTGDHPAAKDRSSRTV